MEAGTFEPEETRLILGNLAERDVLIDVGANVGYYACLALNAGKSVVAFEPFPQNLQVLFRNLGENGWADAEVWPIGLGEKPGLAPIYGAHTGASLVPGWAGVSESWKQMIAVNTMDNVLAHRFAGKGMVIKIDVEGAEFEVLKGARQVLRRQPRPVWIVEITLDIHRTEPNPSFRNTFDLFWQNGYEARTIGGSNRIITKADVDRWLRIGQCDIGSYNWSFSVPDEARFL
jgi:FkbM family methyltransferase